MDRGEAPPLDHDGGVNRQSLPAFIGHRFGHGYLLLPAAICDELELHSGDLVELVVVPRDVE